MNDEALKLARLKRANVEALISTFRPGVAAFIHHRFSSSRPFVFAGLRKLAPSA
jgi:hypothetical protein